MPIRILSGREIGVIVLLFGKDNSIVVLVGKFKQFWEEMDFKNLGNNFCVCGNSVNVLENVNKAFDRPLVIGR